MVIYFCLILVGCTNTPTIQSQPKNTSAKISSDVAQPQKELPDTFFNKLATAAESIENPSIVYDPAYVKLEYPGGDVNPATGVCTDVVIRSYRKLGIDLQQLVHEDIIQNRTSYLNIKRPDTNIDHRRVPNLGIFFERNGVSLPVSKKADAYLPGDIVWWKLGSSTGLNHIGVVVHQTSSDGTRMVIHNIGGGQVIEDVLFQHYIKGHYRYEP